MYWKVIYCFIFNWIFFQNSKLLAVYLERSYGAYAVLCLYCTPTSAQNVPSGGGGSLWVGLCSCSRVPVSSWACLPSQKGRAECWGVGLWRRPLTQWNGSGWDYSFITDFKGYKQERSLLQLHTAGWLGLLEYIMSFMSSNATLSQSSRDDHGGPQYCRA